MNCQECRDLFDDMLDRRMKEPLRQRMQIHLMNCTECNIRFEQWRKAHAALFRALNHFDGLEHLQEGFADRLVAECRRPQHWWQDVSVPKCALIAASLLLLAGFVFAAAEVGGRLYSTGETSPGNDDAAMAQKGEKATEETETTAADSVADYVTVPSVPVVPSVSLTTSIKGETEMTKKNTAAAALSAAMAAAPLAAANGDEYQFIDPSTYPAVNVSRSANSDAIAFNSGMVPGFSAAGDLELRSRSHGLSSVIALDATKLRTFTISFR